MYVIHENMCTNTTLIGFQLFARFYGVRSLHDIASVALYFISSLCLSTQFFFIIIFRCFLQIIPLFQIEKPKFLYAKKKANT